MVAPIKACRFGGPLSTAMLPPRLPEWFRPGIDGERATCFAEGKRHVGNQIIRLIKLVVRDKK